MKQQSVLDLPISSKRIASLPVATQRCYALLLVAKEPMAIKDIGFILGYSHSQTAARLAELYKADLIYRGTVKKGGYQSVYVFSAQELADGRYQYEAQREEECLQQLCRHAELTSTQLASLLDMPRPTVRDLLDRLYQQGKVDKIPYGSGNRNLFRYSLCGASNNRVPCA